MIWLKVRTSVSRLNDFQCPKLPFGSVRRGKVERNVRLARMVDWKVLSGIFPLTNASYSLYTRSLLSSIWSSGPRPHWTLVYAYVPFISPLSMAMISPALNSFGNLVTPCQRKERHDPHFEALERGSVFSRCKLDEELAMSRYVGILSRFWHRHSSTNPRVSTGKTSTILEQRRVALYRIFVS